MEVVGKHIMREKEKDIRKKLLSTFQFFCEGLHIDSHLRYSNFSVKRQAIARFNKLLDKSRELENSLSYEFSNKNTTDKEFFDLCYKYSRQMHKEYREILDIGR